MDHELDHLHHLLIDHLGYLDPMCVVIAYDTMCRIGAVQIQPRKHVLGYTDNMAPTGQHHLYAMQIIQMHQGPVSRERHDTI